jgi:processive 1,2-diacylglycerol beta-glucosyltransferase
VHRAILDVAVPLEIVTVAGRNDVLRDRLRSIPCPSHHRRTVLGYTDKMDELMAGVDVVISKPGGLTTAEALARGVAMLVIEPIPGQEDRNCDFLLENGAAAKVNNLASLSHKLTALVSDRERLQSLRDASLKLGRPQAAFDVARSALSLIERDLPPIVPPARAASRFSRLRLSRLRRSRREPMGVK